MACSLTQPTLEELARGGMGEVDVVCPGFVSDCLETLERSASLRRRRFWRRGTRAAPDPLPQRIAGNGSTRLPRFQKTFFEWKRPTAPANL